MSLYVIPRNWTGRRKSYDEADALLVSIPKSGRTWLRFMLRRYLCSWAGVPFRIDPADEEPRYVPRVLCSHDLWEHLTAPRRSERAKGKYLIPPAVRRRKPVILAVRDLRDVMVSLHLHLTRRGFRSGARFEGDLSQLIRDRRFGVERTVAILNHWLDEWRGTGRLLVWSYEHCHEDPEGSLERVLHFLGFRHVDRDLLARSIDFASFENMQRMERENVFDRKLLRPADREDPESYKVRRGKVGGWVDYLSPRDALLIEMASTRLRL